MTEHITVKTRNDAGALTGPVWAIGWLFTIGFLKLSFGKGVLALILWPFYLGGFFHR
jgi:hypothetical protein